MATPIRRTSFAGQVADQLRDDILSGRIPPGETLPINPLTERFSVSHIPVREAMKALQAEGLLIASSSGSMQVSGANLDDLASLYDLRRILECQLSALAAPKLDDHQIAEIYTLLADLLSTERGSDLYWPLHRSFHKGLLVPCITQWTETVLSQLWRASERYVRLYTFRFGSVDTSMEQHRAMAEACAARDGTTLSTLTEAHLFSTQRAIELGYEELHAARSTDAEADA